MACEKSQSLSIISVAFSDSGFLEMNVELTKQLNRQLKSRWIVVDNTPRSDLSISAAACVEILPGIPRLRSRDRGSLHHAMALEKAGA